MTFWIFAFLLVLLALAFLLPPLWRKSGTIIDDRRDQNILIAKQQLSELEVEYKDGRIEAETYQISKQELEESLYSDLEDAEDIRQGNQKTVAKSSRLALLMVAILLPVFSFATYLKYGNQAGIEESSRGLQQAGTNGGTPQMSIDEMVTKLENRLKKEPNNLTGWMMMGRTYAALNRFSDSVKAYEKANELSPNDPKIMLPLAAAIASSKQGNLQGRPEELILAALKKDPENIMGVWLAGMAAKQRNDTATAVKYWKQAEAKLDPASPDRQELRKLIAENGGKLDPLPAGTATKPTAQAQQPAQPVQQPAATGAGIKVTVSLSDAFKAKVKPEDTIFIYAKAVSGPPMPLAASRKQVKDLPIDITLDDRMAMMPQMKLSGFAEVKVGARISLSGTPQAQPGDLFAEQSPVKAGDSVQLVIDQVFGQQ